MSIGGAPFAGHAVTANDVHDTPKRNALELSVTGL